MAEEDEDLKEILLREAALESWNAYFERIYPVAVSTVQHMEQEPRRTAASRQSARNSWERSSLLISIETKRIGYLDGYYDAVLQLAEEAI